MQLSIGGILNIIKKEIFFLKLSNWALTKISLIADVHLNFKFI